MLAPDGEEWLTRAGRGPEQVLGRRDAARELERLSKRFPANADLQEAIVQDFHSFRQALNVASADQRVLVVVNAPANQESQLRQSLRQVANDPTILGRFHFDFEQGADWKPNVTGTNDQPGIVLIRPGEFGMTGKVLEQLPLDATNEKIMESMVAANETFAATTEKKVYSDHVDKGREEGIYFEGAVPYGEDRDGDGEIDRGRGGAPGGRTGGRGRPPRSDSRRRGGG